MSKVFINSLKKGKIGELYYRRLGPLLRGEVTSLPSLVPETVEGIDYQGMNILHDGTASTKRSEVKTIDNFLSRDNDRLFRGKEKKAEPFGTVPFELFSENMQRDGWLHALTHTAEYNAAHKKTAAYTPDVLAYCLIDAKQDPFCFIVFPDFGALIDRLEGISTSTWGGSIKEWSIEPATNETYWKGRENIVRNMWHVPLSDLADLARVTLLDVSTMELDKYMGNTIFRDLQQQRFQYLKQLSERGGNGGTLEGAKELVQKLEELKATPAAVEELEKLYSKEKEPLWMHDLEG